MIPQNVTDADFFEDRYRRESDPWNFSESDYERSRFETILEALRHQRYRHALEPGCSIGTLTVRLAEICDQVTAFDFSATAVASARERCASCSHVQFSCAALDENTQVEGFDLVILSEIGYYFETSNWHSLVQTLVKRMSPGTTVLASHWLGQSTEHRQEGDAVHQVLRDKSRLRLEYEARHPGFRLDRFTRR